MKIEISDTFIKWFSKLPRVERELSKVKTQEEKEKVLADTIDWVLTGYYMEVESNRDE